MKLLELSYSEYSGEDKHWFYNTFDINNVNLIVGKNASGKSRVLATIRGLGQIFTNLIIPFRNGEYNALFEDNLKQYHYKIKYVDNIILEETLEIDSVQYLTRDQDGVGNITGEESNNKIKFKIPPNQLAIARRDEIQHPSLSSLFNWGTSLRYFKFAKDQEKESLVAENIQFASEQENAAVAISIFQKALKEYNGNFHTSIIEKMNEIGYEIESIEINKMTDIKIISSPFPTELSGIIIKEKDCLSKINQVQMSDGMFRALAILIHFNYYKLKGITGTILIDDIGEGLDFERSTKLIKILVNDAENSNIQLIMSTNDKFIMNSVSLDYWQVIDRIGGKINIFNKFNAKDSFDNFKFTGLNNFDFFSNNFLKEGE